MQQLSLLHLFGQLATLACTILVTCIFLTLLALCMQQPLYRKSNAFRILAGSVIIAALLIVSPLVYRRPRQHMAIGLATMTYMAALTALDWVLLQSAAPAPSMRGMLSSFVWQPMSGIISAYKAKHKKALHSQSAHAGQDTPSPSNIAPHEHPQQQTTRQLLQETFSALFRLMVLMDVVSAVLQCWFCYGDLSSLQPGLSGSGHDGDIAAVALSYLIKGVAGFLLGMQLAATYTGGRIVLLFFGYKDIGPVSIFDKPWMAVSVSDLWSNRWHQVLRFYFTGLGYNLADTLSAALVQLLSSLGFEDSVVHGVKHGTNSNESYDGSSDSRIDEKDRAGRLGWQREVKRAVRTLVVFAMSGLVHEYVVWAAFGVITWQHLTFFMLHGAAVLAEGLGEKIVHHNRCCRSVQTPMWLRRIWVLGFAVVTCPLFVNVLLHHRHYQSYVPPFIVPVTAVTMERLGLCKCA